MTLIRMVSRNEDGSLPDGAWVDEFWSKEGKSEIILQRYAEGLVISLYERNGYDDSDFCAEVWNPEKECVDHITYATTRGWSYPCYGANVDASVEIQEKAKEWKRQDARNRKAKALRLERKLLMNDAHYYGFKTYIPLLRLKRSLDENQYRVSQELLKVKKFRSDFRKSLCEQLRNWALSKKPEYVSPFSYKQWNSLY